MLDDTEYRLLFSDAPELVDHNVNCHTSAIWAMATTFVSAEPSH
jgi:hypothetical protein